MQSSPIKPFVRWPGGKWLFVDRIVNEFPEKSEIGTYYEPFLGSAATFLAYRPRRAFLSDLNDDLIKSYKAVCKSPELVHRYLSQFAKSESEKFYYKTRDAFNSSDHSIRQAARLIYLNKSCFNGIYRVNTNGAFNVPYGRRASLALPTLEQLRQIAAALEGTKIRAQDYKKTLKNATKGDLVYLDPPYPALNGTSFFSHYTKERFSFEEQENVAIIAEELWAKGCFVVVSNADTPGIRKLYKDWTKTRLERPRYITAALKKHKVSELVIRNF